MQKLKTVLQKYARLAVLIIVILTLVSLTRNILKVKKAGQRIDKEREKLAKLEQEHAELEAKLATLQSDVYIEMQIRDGLGLAKEGEYIVIMPDDDELRKLAPSLPEVAQTEPLPNWRKWLNLVI